MLTKSLILIGFTLYFFSCQNAPTKIEIAQTNDSPQTVETPKPMATPTATPKKEAVKDGLVELVKLDDTIKLDIRYATANNFVGKVIYKEARAFMQKPAAEAMVRIHQKLKKDNLGLVIFDGYRPLSATKLFWEVTPANKKKFVANPKNGSRHNRGCAVDLSLFDLKTGENLDMPTEYDNFTEKAAADYAGATESQKKNREILRKAMESDGFKIYAAEWWHFDFQDCPENRILDIEFSEIK
ncbi:MAG TPA: M15 family metallopeptidase [Pyrinomonadaceae bacterium]|nr:M15 family metallopeptidase [Pyrinomonadaceae bacterium]